MLNKHFFILNRHFPIIIVASNYNESSVSEDSVQHRMSLIYNISNWIFSFGNSGQIYNANNADQNYKFV